MNFGALVFFLLGLAVWYGLVGRAGWGDLAVGCLVVSSAWALYTRVSELPNRIPASRLLPWLKGVGGYMLGYVAIEMLRSTLRVVQRVLSPRLDLRPVIIAVRVPDASRAGLVLLAYGISLTPGEQIIAIDEAQGILYVHTMDAPDPEAFRRRILEIYDRYIKEATAC